MFDDVTKPRRGPRAIQSSAYLVASAAFQALCVVAVVLIGDQFRAAATGSTPLVTVKFIRSPPSLPVAPSPPAPSLRPEPKPPLSPTVKSRPLKALVQPKEAPEKLTVLNAPLPEPEVPTATDDDGESALDAAEGTVEGTAGGVVGGLDAPIYPGVGAHKPTAARPNCVQNTLRLPQALQGFVSGPIVVEFAIHRDGTPTNFRMVTPVTDQRITQAIWRAISTCPWTPGTDQQGRPAWFRTRMTLHFRHGH